MQRLELDCPPGVNQECWGRWCRYGVELAQVAGGSAQDHGLCWKSWKCYPGRHNKLNKCEVKNGGLRRNLCGFHSRSLPTWVRAVTPLVVFGESLVWIELRRTAHVLFVCFLSLSLSLSIYIYIYIYIYAYITL